MAAITDAVHIFDYLVENNQKRLIFVIQYLLLEELILNCRKWASIRQIFLKIERKKAA